MTATLDIDGVISEKVSRQDIAALRKAYLDQDEFVVLKNFLPREIMDQWDLYAYTEAGDHIGWHYDTSYYRDRRWTLLVGFQDNSSARLVCRLHARNKNDAVTNLELKLAPGTLVLFNGDSVYHAVTPI